ncbi:MAG: class I SAM-dependent methyltransferase [Anaerolineae bacterium]
MFQRYLDGQYRQPTGLIGRWIGAQMARQHQPENQWTVELLDIQPTDTLLEVGFGPGFAIAKAAERAQQGVVAGVDFSQAMVKAARRRCAAALRAGRVDLRLGDAARLPFADNSFDKAFSIHSIYFWKEPARALQEMHRVLKPEGMVIFTILPRERWNEHDPNAPVGTPDCHAYSGDELSALLLNAGFVQPRITADSQRQHRSNYSIIARKA